MGNTSTARGGRAVRMLDVAAAAGVSRSTVSNVMQGRDSVDAALRERVLTHAQKLGYVYDRGAASLRMRQSGLVGLIVPDLANPFITQAVRGIQAVMYQRGYLVTSIETNDEFEHQTIVLRSLAEHRVDGVILLPSLTTDTDHLPIRLRGVPSVLLSRGTSLEGLPQVGSDDVAVGQLGARHLVLDHRCRTVAYFGGVEQAPPRIQRANAFADFVRSSDAQIDRSWSVPCDATPGAAYRRATALIASANPPNGVYCHSDRIAYGLLRALHEAAIPRSRCRVVGCEDLPDSAFWNPSLTSVAVDPYSIGRVAAQELLRALGETGEPEAVSPPQLHARESCGCRD